MTNFAVLVSGFLLFGSFCSSIFCEGKRMCFTCDTATSGLPCLYTPDNITIGEFQQPCKHYCTIKRNEYINMPGDVIIISLKRECEEHPVMKDGVTAGEYYITYFRSCKSHLCNEGDGLTSLKHIPDDPDEEEEEETNEFESSTNGLHYCKTSVRIFKIYFFAFVAFIFSIT